MYAIMLDHRVHTLLFDADPSLSVAPENWTPVPEAITRLAPQQSCHLRPGTPYADGRFDWAWVAEQQKSETRHLFDGVFAMLDARRARPSAAIAEALALGEPPDPEDVDIIWQINMLAEANRDMLATMEAMHLPAIAADETAILDVLDAVAAITPWLPDDWRRS